jgi:hypothetical protein
MYNESLETSATLVLIPDQESFNSRLKAEGDDGSTNLYISNLPKTLTEVVSGRLDLYPHT